jgi:iron complex outermembrane receptor protein
LFKIQKLLLTATTALVAVGSFNGAFAAAAASASTESFGLEEITVTARKREENLQTAPLSITAFSSKGLEDRGVTNISEIAQFTPNLTFRNTSAIAATSSASSIYIRGIGQQDWALPTDPGVGVYLDGVYVARSIGGVLDMLDVQRVEVLKGPQGTLFGRNTIGGAINFVSKKPDFNKMAGSAEVIIGRFNRTDVRFSFNVPFSDTFAANFAGSRKYAEGYVKNLNPGGPDLGGTGVWTGRAAFRWKAAENFEVNFSVDGTHEREGPAANVLMAVDENAIFVQIANGLFPINHFGQVPDAICLNQSNPARLTDKTCYNSQWIAGPFTTYSTHQSPNPFTNSQIPGHPVSPDTGIDSFGTALDLNWDVNDGLTIKSISSYRRVSGFWSRDGDHSPLVVLQTSNYFTQHQISEELQFQGKAVDNKLKWIVGGYYFQEKGHHIDIVELPGAVFNSGGYVNNDNKAIFGQATYDFTQVFSATVGGRYTDEKKRFHPKSTVGQDSGLGIPAGTLVLPDEEGELHTKKATPYINLAAHVTPDAMVYGTFSQGFKSGTFTQRVFPPRPDVPSARPEKVSSFEVGFKTTWDDNRIRLNGALFWTDYKDMQVNVSEASPDNPLAIGIITRNAAKARIKGGELELNAMPVRNLSIDAGLGYIDAKYTSLDPSAVAAGLTLGSLLVNTPKWTVTAGVAYTIELPAQWQITPRVDYIYTDTIANDANNTPMLVQGPTSVFNASLRLNDPSALWTITAMVKNLTDKTYLISGNADAASGRIEGVYAHPREWSLGVKRSF